MEITHKEVDPERFVHVNDEVRRLKYEERKKELDRNLYKSNLQQELRSQWDTINKVQQQKTDLVLQLRHQESESFLNKGSGNLDRFYALLEKIVNVEDQIKKQKEGVEKVKLQTVDTEKKLRNKQKEIVKVHRAQDRILKHQRNISFLENRLSSALIRYDQLLVSNNALREDINSMLITQNNFRRRYGSIKQLLAAGKKDLTEIIHSATVAYQTGESVKYKLNVIKERSQNDQKKLGEKIKELELLLQRDKELKEFLILKAKERSGLRLKEDLALKTTEELELKIQNYQCILARIKKASSCKDVNRICKVYMQEEEHNLNLFNKVSEMNLEIEKLFEEVRGQRQEYEEVNRQYKEQRRKDLAVKTDIENETESLREEAHDLEEVADTHAVTLETIKRVLQRVYDSIEPIFFLRTKVLGLDATIADDNILLYIESFEQTILDLMRCYKFLKQRASKPLKSGYMKNTVKTRRRASEIPHQIPVPKPKRKTSAYTPPIREDSTEFEYSKKNLDVFAKNEKERQSSGATDVSR